MTVIGGDFGFGCNTLHYVDLFEYLTNSKSNVVTSSVFENKNGNRRGSNYKEFFGECKWISNKNDELIVISDSERKGGNEIIISQNGITHILNEETLNHFIFENNNFKKQNFDLKYTSYLTQVIYKDILNKKCLLPNIVETKKCHSDFFNIINKSLNIDMKQICPIT